MKKFLIIALSLAAVSCEKATEYNGAARDPKMIISAIMGPNMANPADDAHEVYVKESVSIFGDRKPQPVEGAQFTFRHNGVQAPTTTVDGKTVHHFLLAAGDRIELEGSSPLHGTITASDIVPEKAVVKNIEHEWFERNGRHYLRLLVTVADPAGERNYYRFAASSCLKYKYTDSSSWRPEPIVKIYEEREEQEVFYDDEIVFKNADNDPAATEITWTAVSDELFNGKDYTFNLYIELLPWIYCHGSGYEVLSRTATIEVQTISENYFRYIRSIETQAGEHNFSEPTRVFTNVAGGYGILGTYNAVEAVADIKADLE